MKEILLLLDFLCPLIFLLMGRKRKGKVEKILFRESLAVLFAAAVFGPLGVCYYSLAVNCGITATILFCQMIFVFIALQQKNPSV